MQFKERKTIHFTTSYLSLVIISQSVPKTLTFASLPLPRCLPVIATLMRPDTDPYCGVKFSATGSCKREETATQAIVRQLSG